jgi:ribonuclease BN (tRNA processing enzyme)
MFLSKFIFYLTITLFINHNVLSQTQVVLLGTGTPNPDTDRFGPSTAVIVNGVPYIVDGGPGVVRRATAAEKKGIKGLNASNLNRLFITHLHSDHTSGLSDFIFTPAVIIRKNQLQIFGPKGTKKMVKHIMKAFAEDIDLRVNGLEHGDKKSYILSTQQIKEGVIYIDSNVIVKAFNVKHGSWKEAYGYRFETKDKVIVVSGDCTYSENLIKYANDCDILVHEVIFARRLCNSYACMASLPFGFSYLHKTIG